MDFLALEEGDWPTLLDAAAEMESAAEMLGLLAVERADDLRRHAEKLRAIVQRRQPCSHCAGPADGLWFGPCSDGKSHRATCPVGRQARAEAKWPCGRPMFPAPANSAH